MNTATEKTKKYEPYPEYKDSGVEWLGDVPEHWEVDRLRWTVLGCKNGIWGNEPDGVDDLVCVRVADFDRIKFRVIIDEPTVRAVTPSERRGRLLQQGDLLLEKSGGGELQPVGAVMLFEHDTDAVCSNFVARMLVSDGFDSVFLTYLHAHLYARRVNTRSIKQTTGIQNLDSMAYLDERVACPPSTEQQTIADFLDRRTGQIDDLIAKKERVIELLKEKRTVLISHAVTKGLNPDAKMKDSGIDWLGKIPEHWEVCLFKRVAQTSYGLSLELDRTLTEGTKILSLPNVTIEGNLEIADVPYVCIEETAKLSLLLERGDLLFNWRNGSSDHLGKTAYFDLDGEYIHVSFLLKLRFNPEKHDSRYFQRMLNGFRITGFFASSKAGVNNTFNQSELNNLWIMVPPKHEQQAIADYLDRETSRIDALIAKVTEAIEKLKEYRTALISAAVTGKIKVF